MSSIRVKRSRYDALLDTTAPNVLPDPLGTFPRNLSRIFTTSRPRSASEADAPRAPNVPFIDPSASPHSTTSRSPIIPSGRPRSNSRVSHHILNRKRSIISIRGPPFQDRRLGRENAQISLTDLRAHHDLGEGSTGQTATPIQPQPRDGDGDAANFGEDIVEHLDVIDPEVATISSLANAANALVILPLSFYSRMPVVLLPTTELEPQVDEERRTRYEDELDRHIDDLLNRPSKFRRTLRGVWAFLKTPIGIITGIYGFLVVFWGAAIVIFLAKIINFHNPNTQGFWVEVSSQVENGLFTATGLGLLPSRVQDTYRIYKIWYYKRRTTKLRAKAGLPQLYDSDDLPNPLYDPNYVHVLTEDEQNDLHKQQVKFHHHQTWYRPHGTETHRAFPINRALLICCLNDGNSFFQILLCSTMWGLNRFQRPAWSTGTLIPCSFLCGILSAVFIWRGGQETRRTEEVRKRLLMALAAECQEHGSSGLPNRARALAVPSRLVDAVESRRSSREHASTANDDAPPDTTKEKLS